MTKTVVHKKRLKGIVVSNKMEKTLVVEVTRFVKHPKYGKFLKSAKRYKAHVEGTMPKMGEAVLIEETRPMSKEKRFILINQ